MVDYNTDSPTAATHLKPFLVVVFVFYPFLYQFLYFSYVKYTNNFD